MILSKQDAEILKSIDNKLSLLITMKKSEKLKNSTVKGENKNVQLSIWE